MDGIELEVDMVVCIADVAAVGWGSSPDSGHSRSSKRRQCIVVVVAEQSLLFIKYDAGSFESMEEVSNRVLEQEKPKRTGEKK